MSICLEPCGDDAFDDSNKGSHWPTAEDHLEEIWSEDGVFCPRCGKRQGWAGLLVNNANPCQECGRLFWWRKEVHVSNVTTANCPKKFGR